MIAPINIFSGGLQNACMFESIKCNLVSFIISLNTTATDKVFWPFEKYVSIYPHWKKTIFWNCTLPFLCSKLRSPRPAPFSSKSPELDLPLRSVCPPLVPPILFTHSCLNCAAFSPQNRMINFVLFSHRRPPIFSSTWLFFPSITLWHCSVFYFSTFKPCLMAKKPCTFSAKKNGWNLT